MRFGSMVMSPDLKKLHSVAVARVSLPLTPNKRQIALEGKRRRKGMGGDDVGEGVTCSHALRSPIHPNFQNLITRIRHYSKGESAASCNRLRWGRQDAAVCACGGGDDIECRVRRFSVTNIVAIALG